MSTKDRGRTNLPKGEDKTLSKTNIQMQLKNAGGNRVTGKGDHLHRGDQRDRQPQK